MKPQGPIFLEVRIKKDSETLVLDGKELRHNMEWSLVEVAGHIQRQSSEYNARESVIRDNCAIAVSIDGAASRMLVGWVIAPIWRGEDGKDKCAIMELPDPDSLEAALDRAELL